MTLRTKAVLMASGGPDSTTLAYMLRESLGTDFTMLAINHGNQAGSKEMSTAQEFAKQLGVPFKLINISSLWNEFSDVRPPDLLTMMGGPSGNPYALILIAANWAGWAGANSLYMGVHADDLEKQLWIKSALDHYQSVLDLVANNEKSFSHVKITAPFISLSKAEVLRLGRKLGVPFEQTWTCSVNGNQHCGECSQCLGRKQAFINADISDGTLYLN